MFSFTVVAALALSFKSALAIPPEDFGFPSAPNDTALTVVFPQSNGSQVAVSEGELFGANVTLQQPTVALNTAEYASLANSSGPYMVLMVDPDASTPQNPTSRFILHWAQPSLMTSNQTSTNIVGRVLMNTTAPLVPYMHPAPPTDSDAHRYILYAFRQPSNFTVPPQFSGLSATNRTRFNLTSFISAAGLGTPAAAQYFFVSNKTGVPGNFSAPATATYPISGGNGGQITQGPGPSVNPAATATASSSTSSGLAAKMTAMPAAPVGIAIGLGSLLFL